jgi:hypothetical protein
MWLVGHEGTQHLVIACCGDLKMLCTESVGAWARCQWNKNDLDCAHRLLWWHISKVTGCVDANIFVAVWHNGYNATSHCEALNVMVTSRC